MPDLMLTEEEQMLQTTVRDFVDREIAPRAREADEKGEFPPEFQLVVEQAQARAPGREKGDGDRQSDQEHHSWFAGTDLVQRTGEEGAATDDVHHCPEQGRDPACAGEVRDVVTEQHREHG